MALVNMKKLLADAKLGNYAVGSFSVANMEMIIGAIKAAEELRSPIILQIAEVRIKDSPLEYIGPIMVSAAKEAKVPVAVHFDHGITTENIEKVLKLGFTSVMFDGSHLSYEENVKITNRVIELAKKYDASVEAEIGQVGGSEDGSEEISMKTTSLVEAKNFIKDVKVDALAVAIGNAHGVYKGTPKLKFDVLKNLSREINVPLVLHGGTGISEEDFKQCKNNGIKKINIATATFNKVEENVRDLYKGNFKKGYFDIHRAEVKGAYENVKRHIEIFESNNKG